MRILCFGDSNTYGFDPRSFLGDRYPTEDRWTDILENQTSWEVMNAGVNGGRIPFSPHVLFVMLGTNDLLQGVSAYETTVLMEAFLCQLLPHCKAIVLAAPPPMKRGAWVPTDALVTESLQLVEEYQQLAKKLEIPFVDTRNWHIQLAFDGIHFPEEGHHAFAGQLLDYFKASPHNGARRFSARF